MLNVISKLLIYMYIAYSAIFYVTFFVTVGTVQLY